MATTGANLAADYPSDIEFDQDIGSPLVFPNIDFPGVSTPGAGLSNPAKIALGVGAVALAVLLFWPGGRQ